MAGRALLAFAAAVALLILHWLARRSATELPPVEPPAKRFWGKGRGTRLRFRVGRRKGALRAATNESRSDRPLARATTRLGDRPQVSPNETATRCHLDGTETGGGCSGQACLLGACFCSGGSAGEWCERRPASRVACAVEEQQAYSARASGLKRHTAHDACAFYSAPYGTLAVDARRWEAAQVGRHVGIGKVWVPQGWEAGTSTAALVQHHPGRGRHPRAVLARRGRSGSLRCGRLRRRG